MMQPLTAVVIGATGLIGEQLVQQLLKDAAFSKVRILVRRKIELLDPKLEVKIVNFNNPADFRNSLGTGDCIFSCVGTTQKQVHGDNAAYRAIDFDIPVYAAKIGVQAGFTTYLLVSSVGANANSKNFYLQLKGEVEKAVASETFPAFHAFRPSMLLGKRKEFRVAESIGQPIMQALSPLFVAGLKKYSAIDAATVAKAMVAAAKSGRKGSFVHHYEDMMQLSYK